MRTCGVDRCKEKEIQNNLSGGLTMNVQYEQQGNYLIPCIRTKEQEEIHLGVWANRHRQYLKQSHKVRYYNLLTRERHNLRRKFP